MRKRAAVLKSISARTAMYVCGFSFFFFITSMNTMAFATEMVYSSVQ